MSPAPSVSIALATFNGAAYLAPQLRSLAEQRTSPLELVVCDDRSTDDTVAILEDFARSAPFPVSLTVNARQLGYKRNFLKAAQACVGDVVAFCDQDDVWLPTKLTAVAGAMSDPGVSLCFHDYHVVDASGRTSLDHHSQAALARPDAVGAALGLTQAFRRTLLAHSRLHDWSRDENHRDEVMAHDQWIHFLARCAGLTRHIPQALLGYRQHGGNVCGHPRQDAEVERRLSNNPAVLAARLQGDARAFREKRRLLVRDLDWQHFSLVHRIEMIEHLVPRLAEPSRAIDLKRLYKAQLGYVDDRISFYAGLGLPGRLSAFTRRIGQDAGHGLLRSRLKARLLDLTYGAA